MEAAGDVADRFWKDGYVIIRGVFSSSEVEGWREAALHDGQATDLLSRQGLRDLVCDARLVGLARDLLGGRPVYFGDSTAAIGAGTAGFHKDNTDRYDASAPDWCIKRYPTIRFGIYTQPHGRLPAGLDLRIGSHNLPGPLDGRPISAHLEPGDLIVWNGRTSHSANSPRLRLLGSWVVPNGFVWKVIRGLRLEASVYQKHPRRRVALFVTYALQHELLDRHIAYLKTRAYAVENMRGLHWDEDSRAMARRVGLGLLQPDPSDALGQNVDYAPIPYDLAAPAQVVI